MTSKTYDEQVGTLSSLIDRVKHELDESRGLLNKHSSNSTVVVNYQIIEKNENLIRLLRKKLEVESAFINSCELKKRTDSEKYNVVIKRLMDTRLEIGKHVNNNYLLKR